MNRLRPAVDTLEISFADAGDLKSGETYLRARTEQLLSLLGECRRRRRIDPLPKMPEQTFPDIFFIHRDNEIDQHSGRQCPFSGKIPVWISGIPFRLLAESPNDGK